MSVQSATVVLTRAVTAAAGVFAPGHLGELTQLVPFELADDVLEQTRTVQRRVRDLPSRVGVYYVLALGLFPRLGYLRVWARLTAGLDGLPGLEVARPSEKALRDLRRRLGPAPLKALFEVLAGPLAWPYAPGVRFGGLRTVAFDGCSSLRFPDTDRNRAWLGRIRHPGGFAGYPALRLMTLAGTGTRGLLGAAIGAPADGDEPALARRLLHLLGPGMLLLATVPMTRPRSWLRPPRRGRSSWSGARPPAAPWSCMCCPTGRTCHRSAAWTCGSSTPAWR